MTNADSTQSRAHVNDAPRALGFVCVRRRKTYKRVLHCLTYVIQQRHCPCGSASTSSFTIQLRGPAITIRTNVYAKKRNIKQTLCMYFNRDAKAIHGREQRRLSALMICLWCKFNRVVHTFSIHVAHLLCLYFDYMCGSFANVRFQWSSLHIHSYYLHAFRVAFKDHINIHWPI